MSSLSTTIDLESSSSSSPNIVILLLFTGPITVVSAVLDVVVSLFLSEDEEEVSGDGVKNDDSLPRIGVDMV